MALRALQGPAGGTAPVGGSGNPNTIPRWTGATTLGDSGLTDDGTTVTAANRALSWTRTSGLVGTINRQDGNEAIVALATSGTVRGYFGAGASKAFNVFNNAATSELLTILNGGNVGIGTAGPGARVDSWSTEAGPGGSGISQLRSVYTGTIAANTGGSLALGGYFSGTTATAFAYIVGAKDNATGGDYAGHLQFWTRPNGGSYTERMRISSAGTQAASQVAIGTSSFTSGRALTTVADLDVFGVRVGRGANGVSGNVAVGDQALNSGSLSGSENVAIGFQAATSLTTGARNVCVASYAGGLMTTGTNNVAVGFASMYAMTTTSGNASLGFEAARYVSSGAQMTAATDSVFIGRDARPSANSETNQIVIGAEARGNGSNTATIGSPSTVSVHFDARFIRLVDSYTVGALPAAGTQGRIARVTDGDAALAWGATVVNTGAGATPYLVWDNGTNWTVFGK